MRRRDGSNSQADQKRPSSHRKTEEGNSLDAQRAEGGLRMWGNLFNYFRHLLTLAEATQRLTADQRELRKELKEITAELQQLKSELRRGLDGEKHEREKLLLQLENQLLRFERTLPPARSDKGRDKKQGP